jgi:hypothetical protein
MIDDIAFVIKRAGEYLNGNDTYGTLEYAWYYQSKQVFEDAENNLGDVFLIFPSGREISVCKEDFEEKEE